MRIEQVCDVEATEKRITSLGIHLLPGDWKLYPGCNSTYGRGAIYGGCPVAIDLYVSLSTRQYMIVRLYISENTDSSNMICAWELPRDGDDLPNFVLRG